MSAPAFAPSSVSKPVIAIIPGDCTGIGPELTARILAERRAHDVARLVFIGDARVLELGMRQARVKLDYRLLKSPQQADWNSPRIPVVDLDNINPDLFPPGVANPDSGRLTGDTLAAAIEFARDGLIDGVTFAPLNKRALYEGGWRFPDEHKMFAHLLGHRGLFGEMNVLDNQWMTRATSHVALKDVAEQITFERICDALRLADDTMRKAGIDRPRIAVAALNPHNGEGGLFGREEIDIIAPAVQKMAAEGIDCEGPFPCDTVYIKAFAGNYDSVLSMYHDQGQIATKLKGFNKGVTITAGLDIVFTTPSHGTAFDIVGKGIADLGAFEAAIRLAARIATRKASEKCRAA